jgi:putative salt-induced outer membrane protein YdiY
MVEVKAIDGGFALQAGELEATFDGTLVTGLEFTIDQRFQGLRQAEVLSGGVGQHLIQMKAHRRQIQLIEFLLE